ncbi:MAG: nucleotide exchange factor GrpE [Anaerolineae bacterium]|nr:nucleotide exchange factor GrpE [Anaerolineae bacterium]
MKKKPVRIPIRRSDNAKTDAGAIPLIEPAPPERNTAQEPVAEVATEAPDAMPPEKTKPITEETIDWRDQALRLQAEMDNYRKRQQKLAEDNIAQAKASLLLKFLNVVDNLKRVLSHLQPDNVHDQSIKLVYDEMLRILQTEGADPIKSIGESFNPELHEAVAMIPASPDQKTEMEIIEEEQAGYRLAGRLLRPARVIVAKK